MAPVIRGNSLYKTATATNYGDSKSQANLYGGNLAAIENLNENAFLVSTYAPDYWCLYAGGKGNPRRWENDTEMSFTNWQPGQDVWGYNVKLILKTTFASWERGWFQGGWQGTPYGDTVEPTPQGPSASAYLIEIPLSSSSSFSSSPKEGAGVFTTSINLSAGTQSTGNLAEGAQVWWKVSGITAYDLESGALTGTGTITNGKLDILHSLKADADTGEKFEVSVYSDSGRTQQIGTTTSAAVLEAPVIRGNSLYTIVDGPSWTQAEANSVKLGGHLTAITSPDENYFVGQAFTTFKSKSSNTPTFWIGATDRVEEGKWEWLTGEKYDYNNFNKGTNNYTGNDPSGEDYAVTWIPSAGGGYWNDLNNSHSDSDTGIAETPFIRRGDSAYVIVQGPTWEEAEANAVKLGGHLVTINDAAENEWIMQNLSPIINTGRNPDTWNGAWIGLCNMDLDERWEWISGEHAEFINWNSTGYIEPNRSWGNDYYAHIYTQHGPDLQGAVGKWNDTPSPDPHGVFSVGLAEIKLAPNNAPTGTPTLSGTTKVGQVISIDKTPIQDADNFTGYTPTYNYHWEVSNENATNWTKLTSTDAIDNNNTYTLTTAEVGKMIRGVVSYLDGYGTNESVASAGSSVITAPVVRGNSLYTIVDGPSWTQAEANSVKLGGHLVTINDAAENEFVSTIFNQDKIIWLDGGPQRWIGFNDIEVEGNWVWTSQEPVTYTNWASPTSRNNAQQPDNFTNQDYAVLNFTTYGNWDDARLDIPNGGIAETPFIRRGDSAYVIVQGPTWEEAEANAVKLGGHLVTINDAEENDWILKNTKNLGVEGNTGDAFIGLKRFGGSDPVGDWRWTSGEASTYTNWYYDPTWGYEQRPNITNNPGATVGMIYLDYPGRQVGKGFWNDTQNDVISFFKGIAEIKLAPNNIPTGSPSITGSLKAGSTITIDATTLKDADNFTGYTPTYNYSFEVSSENGVTWTKLTSTDATDNNTTYTLTTAEVGNQVRGVVSYLDGYGTIESVASAGSTNVLAPSNTVPTALQTLRGSSKVGRVLTADKSTIIDPDGVPTSLSYRWEVSTNGTTWTTLTSADATDNNSTYALTAAELGKTVRSVISYTDNFGTNEVVNSAPTIAVVANAKPTSISLSTSSIAENIGANKAVATLRSVDVDTDDAYTYALVSGTGSTDNSRFTIAGDKLTIIGNPDFETKNSYSIRVRTTDLGGLIVDKSLVLKVTNVNEAPDAISLSDTDFQENIVSGSVIASLTSRDPDKETIFTYSLTPNAALATFADNQFFSIVNDQLKINASANFEQKDSYTISVRSTDAEKLFYDQVFTLVVQDVDEAPTNISITGTGIEEGAAVGSIVGSLVSTDQDGSSTDFTYEFVAGTKANNNDLFEIVGDQLKAKATFNFEAKSSYLVNVRTTDESGLTFTKSITIKVNNVNENPTDLTISATAFNENVAIGSTVATLKFVDPDTTGTYTYSLVSGVGDKDNQAFLIAGDALKVNVATDYEVQKSYAVRLRVTDQGGLFFEKSVALGVNNLVEKVSSAVSTTLASNKDTLELTGTKNISGMGNQFDNTITGNTGKNKLTGGLGKDTLKGGAGVDTFFYNDLKESLLSGYDIITDYAAGEKISLANPLFEGDDLIASTGKATAFNEGAISSVLTNTTFLANNAAAFTVEGLTGTFLALNDGRDGFQADSDALIHLSKYTIGSTTPISII